MTVTEPGVHGTGFQRRRGLWWREGRGNAGVQEVIILVYGGGNVLQRYTLAELVDRSRQKTTYSKYLL